MRSKSHDPQHGGLGERKSAGIRCLGLAVVAVLLLSAGACGPTPVTPPSSGTVFPEPSPTKPGPLTVSPGLPTHTAAVSGPTPSRVPTGEDREALLSFVVRTEASFDLYTVRRDGSGLRLVWSDPGLSANVAWSPDCSRIAFTYYPFRPNNTAYVYMASSDGRNLTRLSPDADSFAPVWSPDGRRIAYHWSPRGSSAINLCVVETESGEVTHLTHGEGRNVLGEWSPDGQRIFFLSDRDDGQRFEVYVMDADGSQERKLTATGLAKSYLDLSSDGAKVLFVGATIRDDTLDPMLGVSDTAFRLFVMNSDGSGLRELSGDSWEQIYDPRWSPQGDRIVFVGITAQGERAIYVTDLAGGMIVLAKGEVAHPIWSLDGMEIAFRCEDDLCIVAGGGGDVRRLGIRLPTRSLLQWVWP